MRNEVFIKEIFDSYGKNFYQLPTYVLRHLQIKLFPHMKPNYLEKYVYEDLPAIPLDDDMMNSQIDDENLPPNVKYTTTKDMEEIRRALAKAQRENTLRNSCHEEEESFF